MLKAVIFDADGVMFDTEWAVREATKKVFLKLYNVGVADEACQIITGKGTDAYLVEIGNKYHVHVDLEEAMKLRFHYFKQLLKGDLKVFPGVKKLIQQVKRAGLKVGVATSGAREKLQFTFRESGFRFEDFDIVMTKDDVEYTKPHPEVYLRILKAFRISPKECVVIEDSITGVTAAKRAGVYCIAVTNSFPKKKLKRADLIVDSLTALSLERIVGLTTPHRNHSFEV